MHWHILFSLLTIGGGVGSLCLLNESEVIFRVKHALEGFGFEILPKIVLSKDCQKWLGYSFYSINQQEFLDARQKCVKPVKFSELARGQGLIPIDPWSPDIKKNNQPDWLWASSIYDKNNSSIQKDIKKYIKLPYDSRRKSNKMKKILEKNLKDSLEQFTDDNKKQEFTTNLSNLLIILEYVKELKLVCWALQDTHHNSDYKDLSKDWNFYIKYCTKFSVD